jgi:ATP-dependent RNA helicase RhlE
MDHMRHNSVDFTGLEVLVLDEADRMLDMGFWPDVQRILTALPAKRQTLLFSATMAGEVMKLTQEFLHDPKFVQVGRRGGPAATISHSVQTVPANEKTQWLAKWLREEATGPVLVFCRTKIGAEKLANRLSGMGIRTAALHADRTQQQRMQAMEGFRTGTYPVLVATDVAARGIDIEGIAHVVNFEVPDTPEAYVHRVGRTGRAEASGSALTLVAPEELRALRALEKAVGVQLEQ